MVELSSLLKEGPSGVGLKRLTAGLPRLKEVHDELRRGEETWRWPHLVLPDEDALAAVVATAEALRERAGTLAVVGQPGALTAMRALVATLAPGAAVRWIGSPDAAGDAALDGPGVAWLCLEGPAWVDRVAEWAVGRDRAVAVAGAGEGEAPPEGWWIADPTAGDGRFGGLGMASLLCAAWAGVDVGEVVAGARDVAEICRRPALFENPAYSLAVAGVAIEQSHGLPIPVHLATTSRLLPFVEWVVRMWAAVVAQPVEQGGVRRHLGTIGIAGALGDEELTHALLGGARDKHLVLWEIESAGRGPATEALATQARVFGHLWSRQGLPQLRVRIPAVDAASVGGAIVLASHAAVATGLYLERDPLGLEGVATWYGAMERAVADVDEGAGTA